MALADVVQKALEKIQFIAKTETVIGEPIVAGEYTIIPVSKVSIGFAAAGGGKESSYGSGEGTGGGINITPVAFISVYKDKIQVHSLVDTDPLLNKIMSLTPDVVEQISRLFKKDKKNDSQ